jgi:hypothetical protein
MFAHFRNAVRKRIGPGDGLAVVLAVWCCPTAVWGQLELAPQVRVLAHSPNLNAGHSLGYWPVVCVIENGSDRRYEIEVRCPETATYRHVNWRALRKVTVEPRSTARVTLWLPAPAYSELALQFFVNGRQVDNTLRFSGLSRSGFMLAHTPRVLASSDAARFARGLVFGDHSDWLPRGFLRERQVRFELTEQPQQMYSSSWSPHSGPWVTTMPYTGPVGIGSEAFIQRELALCVWDAPRSRLGQPLDQLLGLSGDGADAERLVGGTSRSAGGHYSLGNAGWFAGCFSMCIRSRLRKSPLRPIRPRGRSCSRILLRAMSLCGKQR